MKRQWITLVALIVMICAVLGGAAAAQADTVTVEAPTNVQVSATTVGKPYTVTWEGTSEGYYIVNLYAADGSLVHDSYADSQASMYHSMFRMMPGTYTVGVRAAVELDNEGYTSDEVRSKPFTVASSGKTWDYVVSGGKAKIVAYYGTDADVEIPATLGGYPVTTIGRDAFYRRNIRSVTLPASVKEIEEDAFFESTLSAVTIGADVRVGRNAFYGCADALVVTGYTASDAEEQARNAGAAFVSSGTLAAAPEMTAKEVQDDYDSYIEFTVSDPDAECYDVKTLDVREHSEHTSYNLQEIFYPGQDLTYKIWSSTNLLRREVSFRVLKNGAWSNWTEPYVCEYEVFTGELDFENVIPLTSQVTSVDVDGANTPLIRIQPDKTETYSFTSEGESDTYAALYNAQGNIIFSDDDSGEGSNFDMSMTLNAGETYYLSVRFYDRGARGNISVVTGCSRFNTLARPEMTVTVNENGDYVLHLSSADADSFRVKVKVVNEMYDYYFNTVTLEAENGTATYELEGPVDNSPFFEVNACVVKGDDVSPWTETVVLKTVAEGTENGMQWKRTEDGEVTIVNYVGHDSRVVVPATINGMPVTRIASKAFIDNDEIGTVVLPEGLREIGDQAFIECDRLYMVRLPESLKYLGGHAFSQCYDLAVVNLPAALEVIGDGAFEYCSYLEWIYIPYGADWEIPYGLFRGCDELVIESAPGCAVEGLALGNNVSYIPADEQALPEQAPEVSLSEPLLIGGDTEVLFSMPGAEMFRMLLVGDYFYMEDGWHERELRKEEFDAHDGEAAFMLEDYDNCLAYYVQASAYVNGQWTPWSKPLEIKPTSLGKLDKPVPVIDGTVTAGQPFSIHWQEIENALSYDIYVIDQDDEYGNRPILYNGESNEVELIWNRPAGDYWLVVSAYGERGWLTSESSRVAVHVERGETDFTYESSEYEDGLTITGFIGLKSAERVEIPAEIDDQPVVHLSRELLSRHPSVRSIVVPATVKYIDWGVFRQCSNLESVEFQGPVVINNYILQSCHNLTSIIFNDAGANVSQYVLQDIYPNDTLTIYGFTGSDVELLAAELGYEFESIGKLPDCPEFTLAPESEREGGLAYPDDAIRFTMTDPDVERVDYRITYTYLNAVSSNDNSVNYSTGTLWAGDEGGVATTFWEGVSFMDPALSVRAYKNGGWTVWSEPVSMGYTTERMPKVTGVQASVVDGKCVVTWDAVEDAGNYSIAFVAQGDRWERTSHQVYRTNSVTIPWVYESGTYDVYVQAVNSVKGDRLRGLSADPVRVTLQKDPRDRFFDVSANKGTPELSPVNVFVYAKDANRIELRVKPTEGNEWLYTSSWGGLLKTNINDIGTHEYIAYATWDNGETWSEIGRQTVTMTLLGALEQANVNLPPYLRAGEDLVFTIDEVEHAAQYHMSMIDGYGYWVINNRLVNPGTPITIPASQIVGESVRVVISVSAPGYQGDATWHSIRVMPETTHTDVVLSAEKSEVILGEQIKMTVTAPGATCVLIYSNNGGSWTYRYTGGQDTITWTEGFWDEGVQNLFVRCYYGDTSNFDPYDASVYDGPSNAVTVKVISLGDAPLPEVVFQTPTEEDLYLRANVIPTGVADRYYVNLYEDGRHIYNQEYSVDQEHPMETLEFSYPVNLMRDGCTYTAGVHAERQGYISTDAEVADFRYVRPGEKLDQIFKVSSTMGIVDAEPVEVLLYAAGANCVRLDFVDNGMTCEYFTSWSDTLRRTLNDFFTNREYIAYASYDQGETWVELGRETITMSYYGTLAQPEIEVVPYIKSGEDLVFTVKPVEHADSYYIEVYDYATYTYVYTDRPLNTGTITIPASQLTENMYRINVWTYGKGYLSDSGSAEIRVLSNVDREFTLTANHDVVDTGTDVTLTVDAPGASLVWLYDNANTVTYYWYNDAPLKIRRSVGTGKHAFFVRAYYGDTNDLNFYDYEKFTGVSNTVYVTGFSYGQAGLPTVEMPAEVAYGDDINIVLTPNGYAERYSVELRCAYSENASWGATMHAWDIFLTDETRNTPVTLTYPSNALIPGAQYSLMVRATAKSHEDSYFYSENDGKYILIGDRTAGDVLLSIDRSTLYQYESVNVLAFDPDADEIQITTDDYVPTNTGMLSSVNGYWMTRCSFYDLGEHTINAWSYKGGEWVKVAECKVIVEERPILRMGDIRATNVVNMGDMITVKVPVVENAQSYSAILYDENGSQLDYVTSAKRELQLDSAVVPAEGIYYVSACANAIGYESMWVNRIPVMVTSGLNTLSLPAGTTVIEDEAFAGINAEYVVLSDSVTSIGSRAFANCTNLKVVAIPASVTSIAYDAFADCGHKLMVITELDSTAYGNYMWHANYDVALFAD